MYYTGLEVDLANDTVGKHKFYKYQVWYLNPIVHRHICSRLNFHGAIIPIVVQISTTTCLYGEAWDLGKAKQMSTHFSSGVDTNRKSTENTGWLEAAALLRWQRAVQRGAFRTHSV